MRWKQPQCGDQRTRRKFLWLPLALNYEVRWLEFAWVAETYKWNSERKGWKPFAFRDQLDSFKAKPL